MSTLRCSSSTSCCTIGPQLPPRQRIDADARLVEQQQVRGSHQRAGQAQLLLHAAGELARGPRGERRQVGHREQPSEALRADRLRYAVQVGVEIEVLLNAQVLVEPKALRHVADAILDRLRLRRDVDVRARAGVRRRASAVRRSSESASSCPHRQGRPVRSARPTEPTARRCRRQRTVPPAGRPEGLAAAPRRRSSSASRS